MYSNLTPVYSIVYDKYRNRCASGSMDNTVKLWDIATGECLQTFTGHTSLVGLLGMSPNNIVSAAADASLRVWDANTHELKHVLSSHPAAITCFQHDETKVVSGSDGTLKLWDIRSGRFVMDLITGTSSVWQVAFNGGLLVAASHRNDNTVFDVFDFGDTSDPSGIDDPSLDAVERPAWAEAGSRTPLQVHDTESDDDPVWIDVGGMSPETVERWKGLSVHAQDRSQRGAGARYPSASDGSTPVAEGRHDARTSRGATGRSRQVFSEPGDDRPAWIASDDQREDEGPSDRHQQMTREQLPETPTAGSSSVYRKGSSSRTQSSARALRQDEDIAVVEDDVRMVEE